MRVRLVTAPKAGDDRADELRAKLDALRGRLASAGGDQTIGGLFAEMAATSLERGCAADADPVSRAAAIVDDVLPRYFDYQARIRR
jgi:hypothetical protein